MVSIFANVEADINEDLIGKFSQDFDFELMLQKVCEEAGVVVVSNMDEEGKHKISRYRLKVNFN